MLDELPEWLAPRIVKWKAELSTSEYKKLEPEHKKIVDKLLVTSYGLPTLEVIEPKQKGDL